MSDALSHTQNPVLAHVIRGPVLECVHRGAIAVCDAKGDVIYSAGNIEIPIFPRSANKGLQALRLVESGAADAFHLTEKQLALACSSHNGEPDHVATADSILLAAGLSQDALECGPQMPRRQADQATLIKQDSTPCRIHNNCSGKHSGMLATAAHEGIDLTGYVKADHPIQMQITATMEEMYEYALLDALRGTDGCSIPTYAVPLRHMAHAFAKFCTGSGLLPTRAKACERLMQSAMAEPFMVAGSNRFCTKMMEALPGRTFVKTGAEGVFCGALPELGLGIALKIDDGAHRGSEVVMAALIDHFLTLDDLESERIQPLISISQKNWDGLEIGSVSAHLSY